MSREGLHLIVDDLITRTETAVNDVAGLCLETGIRFHITDVVDAVERALPANYPLRSTPDTDRRDIIQDLAHKILTGEMYEDDDEPANP